MVYHDLVPQSKWKEIIHTGEHGPRPLPTGKKGRDEREREGCAIIPSSTSTTTITQNNDNNKITSFLSRNHLMDGRSHHSLFDPRSKYTHIYIYISSGSPLLSPYPSHPLERANLPFSSGRRRHRRGGHCPTLGAAVLVFQVMTEEHGSGQAMQRWSDDRGALLTLEMSLATIARTLEISSFARRTRHRDRRTALGASFSLQICRGKQHDEVGQIQG
jgi:hypothetical protein